MSNVLKYDNIVIGRASTGAGVLNLLAQQNENTLSIGLDDNFDASSNKNTGSLIQGAGLVFDISGDEFFNVLRIDYSEIKELMQMENTLSPSYIIMQKLNAKFYKVHPRDGNNRNKNLRKPYYKVLNSPNELYQKWFGIKMPANLEILEIQDTTFDFPALTNNLLYTAHKKFPGQIKFVSIANKLDLKILKNGELYLKGNQVIYDKLFITMGFNTFTFIKDFFDSQNPIIISDKSLPTHLDPNVFFELYVSPVLLIESENRYANIITDLNKQTTLVKRNINGKAESNMYIYYDNTIQAKIDILNPGNVDQNMKNELYEKLRNSFEESMFNGKIKDEWTCNILVKKIKENGSNDYHKSYSNTCFQMPNFDNIYVGLAGRSTSSPSVARDILVLAGYDKNTLEFQSLSAPYNWNNNHHISDEVFLNQIDI
jgi:hypothetical protein